MSTFAVGDRVRHTSGGSGTVARVVTRRPPEGVPWFTTAGPWYEIAWDHGHPGFARPQDLVRT